MPETSPQRTHPDVQRADGTFHTPAFRLAWFSELVTASVPNREGPLRVLDVGCGTGDQIFDLAPRLPNAAFTGVDIAPMNIEAAERRRRGHQAPGRFTFVTADYSAFDSPRPFDLVVHYSFLHFLPRDAEWIARRLAADTAPGGVLVNAMPLRCAYNIALSRVRRVLRAVRGRVTDAAILQAARLLHGREFDTDLLAERVQYLYEPVVHYDDEISRALEGCGFRTVARERVPHASPGQLRHLARTMRRA